MQKLIKLSDEHYIIVDDSEIKEVVNVLEKYGDGSYKITEATPMSIHINNELNDKFQFKITHSTESLENGVGKSINGTYPTKYLRFDKVKQLSLSEVEEVINGYNIEKMAEDYGNIFSLEGGHRNYAAQGWLDGFKAHQELVKDKLFIDRINIKSLQELVDEGYEPYDSAHHLQIQRLLKTVEVFIQSLLTKTEWDIEFDKKDKIKLI